MRRFPEALTRAFLAAAPTFFLVAAGRVFGLLGACDGRRFAAFFLATFAAATGFFFAGVFFVGFFLTGFFAVTGFFLAAVLAVFATDRGSGDSLFASCFSNRASVSANIAFFFRVWALP